MFSKIVYTKIMLNDYVGCKRTCSMKSIIKGVATIENFSIRVVSGSLNNSNEYLEKTKEIVLSVVEEVGY